MYLIIYMMLILCSPKVKEKEGYSGVGGCTLLQHGQFATSSMLIFKPVYQSISLDHQLIFYHQGQAKELQWFQKLMILKDYFTISDDSFLQFIGDKGSDKFLICKLKLRCMVLLLLLLSGNVQPNPGPTMPIYCFPNPSDYKSRTGLGFVHMNVRSLVPKMDMVRKWANTTNADILVLSETWFNKSITDYLIFIDGYKVYRTDKVGKGGGVAMCVRSKFISSVSLSITKTKGFEFLAVKVGVSENFCITVIGC